MLRYFRINDPYRLVGLLILLLIIYLPLFIDPAPITLPELRALIIGEKIHEGSFPYAELADNTGPFAMWFHGLMDVFFGRSLLARHIIAFFIIFFQSAYLGIIFIDKKVFSENTFIPSLIFSLLFCFSFDALSLGNELLGLGFLLLTLNGLFKEIEFRVQRDETVFFLGVSVSFASLFLFSYTIYLVAVIVILSIYTRTPLRKYLLLVFGYLLPHLVIISIYYLNGSADELWNYYYMPNLSFSTDRFISSKGLFVLASIPLGYLLISLFMLNREARFSKYQSQLLFAIMLWLGFSFLYFFFMADQRPQSLVVFTPGLSFLFTHFFLLIRRRKFAEMNVWVIVLGIVAISYLARYGKLESVKYDRLFVSPSKSIDFKDEKIVVLGEDYRPYLNNRLATPYLNWDLSKEVFEHPEYYENVINVFHAFKNDPPKIIIDKNHVIENFFRRIPELKLKYKKAENDLYILK